MDFLRLISDDLQALRSETRKKYPVVREAVDKAAEALPFLQKQYAATLRLEGAAPGPGHAVFKSESILRPFLIACNHTNASHKLIILALVSIQRLVSWDAIEQSSVGSILRVLQIQAEKNTHSDVQVKLLQTLLQLVTLGYEEKEAAAPLSSSNGPLSGLTLHQNGSNQSISAATPAPEAENALVGSEDLVMQAIWICIHLHGASSGASSVVGNTAAMTIRQVVSLAFGKVHKSPEAKRVGVLVFQELCFLSREESGVWLKRTTTSPMSAALSVELLETILSSHHRLFRDDAEFSAVLKQHVCSLMQTALEMGCVDKHAAPSSSSAGSGLSLSVSTSSSSSSSSSSNSAGPFFPLLVRVMRLASVVLCHFSDILPDECTVIVRGLLEIVATGAFYQPTTAAAKSPSHAKIIAQDVKTFLSHSSSSSSSHGGSTGTGGSSSANGASNGTYVTWPVLLSLEVLNRVCLDAAMVAAITQYTEPLVVHMARTLASVITTSPPSDFRPSASATESLAAPRSGLELLNEQDTPALQPFFSAIRVALTGQSNLVTSIFDLSRTTDDSASATAAALCLQCVSPMAPSVIHAANAMMRHCREVELITMSLKAYHVLATTASRLRATVERSRDAASESSRDAVSKMDDVVVACLRALCAFSFPLPDGIKSNTRALSIGTTGSLETLDESVSDDGESCIVVLTWREVHAMKALFGAAHIMDEELTELEWCALLEGFEIVVGLTDANMKTGQNKIPTKNYRISAVRVEDEDVEQQLVMLAHSIVEFFRDALKLSSAALRKLLSAVRTVCWDQVGLPLPARDSTSSSASTAASAPSANSSARLGLPDDLPALATSHHMKIYQNYLGVGLAGSGTFQPCFALRMLTQLAASSKRCFEEVMKELVLMSTCVSPTQFPQLHQFQVFTTDNILQLMQDALMNAVNSLSPTSKAPSQGTRAELEAYARANPPLPHVFDQHELFAPLATLVRSDLKDRALVGILALLNACGHLIHTGWPLVLGAIEQAGAIGEAKTQVLAFKCLRVIVDDLLAALPKTYVPHCVSCIGRFASCAKDVNISLTAVNELWSVADIIGKQTKDRQGAGPAAVASSAQTRDGEPADDPADGATTHWTCVFRELSAVGLDDRTEVRNSAINTLFGTAVTYGAQFRLHEWQLFIDDTVLPLAQQLTAGRTSANGGSSSEAKAPTYVMHHSRDNVAKQWDESRVLLLTGVTRVLQTNWQYLLAHTAWVARTWHALLAHIAANAARGMSKEVVLAAVSTLQTLLQVASAGDFDQIAQSQPVRAGAGMRVVGGALVASAPTSNGVKRLAHGAPTAPLVRDPALWEAAFAQLVRLCDDRHAPAAASEPDASYSDDDEQEIASAVVAVLVTLYTQATAHEFKLVANVEKLLDVLETLLLRHVLRPGAPAKTLATITTNSLQSRVLNAFEDCGSFAAHPQVHTKVLDQLVQYVSVSASRELVFVTRHALTSLAKLYASVSPAAQRARFLDVLFCIQPFLKGDAASALGRESASSEPSPSKPQSATQKAAAQLWIHALRVLVVLISHGLAAVALAQSCWQPLLATINLFLQPGSGTFPPFVQTEEDEVLVLSVLECMVDSVIALLASRGDSDGVLDAASTAEFASELLGLLCSGVDATKHNKQFIKSCVRQLATLSLQRSDDALATLAQLKLVNCSSSALHAFASLEAPLDASSRTSSERDAAACTAARERVLILLASACEVAMGPRRVLELFPALCACITSSDRDVRELIQRLLLQARVADVCLDALDRVEQQHDAARSSLSSSSSSQHQQQYR